MKVKLPISSKEGDDYLIRIESIDKNIILPDFEISSLLNNIEILEISLERVNGNNHTEFGILHSISECIANVLMENANSILYFYCDDIHPIPNSRNRGISSQKYRSQLFSGMFDRYVHSKDLDDIRNIPLEIKLPEREIYIHLIARTTHFDEVNIIKDVIIGQTQK